MKIHITCIINLNVQRNYAEGDGGSHTHFNYPRSNDPLTGFDYFFD